MCGIGGFSLAPGSTLPVKQMAHDLLVLLEERGKDASGWAYQTADKTMYHKDAVLATNLRVRQIPDDAGTVIVHTRNMTIGGTEDERNNHPLISSDNQIVLIHNGVIDSHDRFRQKYKDLQEVDSAVVPELIADFGPAGLSQLNDKSWAALSWLDARKRNQLNLATTIGAPLIMAKLRDGSLMFASTWEAIIGTLRRAGVDDQLKFAYALPEYTYIEVIGGEIEYMENLERYSYNIVRPEFRYIPGVSKPIQSSGYQNQAQKDAEQKRLKDITEGKQSANPTKATPPTTAPASRPAPTTTPVTTKSTVSTVGPVSTEPAPQGNLYENGGIDEMLARMEAAPQTPSYSSSYNSPGYGGKTPATTKPKGKGTPQVRQPTGTSFFRATFTVPELKRLRLWMLDSENEYWEDYKNYGGYEDWSDDVTYYAESFDSAPIAITDWGIQDRDGNRVSLKPLIDWPAVEVKYLKDLLANRLPAFPEVPARAPEFQASVPDGVLGDDPDEGGLWGDWEEGPDGVWRLRRYSNAD